MPPHLLENRVALMQVRAAVLGSFLSCIAAFSTLQNKPDSQLDVSHPALLVQARAFAPSRVSHCFLGHELPAPWHRLRHWPASLRPFVETAEALSVYASPSHVRAYTRMYACVHHFFVCVCTHAQVHHSFVRLRIACVRARSCVPVRSR